MAFITCRSISFVARAERTENKKRPATAEWPSAHQRVREADWRGSLTVRRRNQRGEASRPRCSQLYRGGIIGTRSEPKDSSEPRDSSEPPTAVVLDCSRLAACSVV